MSEGSRVLKSSLYLAAQLGSARAKGLDLIQFVVSWGLSQRRSRPNSTLKGKVRMGEVGSLSSSVEGACMDVSFVHLVVYWRALPSSTSIAVDRPGRDKESQDFLRG